MDRYVAQESLMHAFRVGATLFLSVFLVIGFAHSAMAVIVYDNSSHFRRSYSISTGGHGDEITLGGTAREVIELHIGVSMHGFGRGDVQAWMYANDGPDGKPGTVLWESRLIRNYAFSGGEELIVFGVPRITVPDTFTWILESSNTTPHSLGLPRYYPPSIGSSGDHAWFGVPGNWGKTIGTPEHPRNYMARVIAVPEPGSILLLSLGGVLLRRRRSRA